MQILRAWQSAVALLFLSMSAQFANAQCVVVYFDFDVDTTMEEIRAWSYVEDYFNQYYCAEPVLYQWGYWEHTYETYITITSPTQNTGYDEDFMFSIPYGGGWAWGETYLPIGGDPGQYIIDVIWRIFCTAGEYFIDDEDDEVVEVPPMPLIIRLTFDDGPTSCCGTHNTLKVINTLASNSVLSNLPAAFFVQTHVPNRMADPGGKAASEAAIDDGHKIVVHTGSVEDHTLHTVRVGQGAYCGSPATNALECDLARAKVAIANLDGGSTPEYVRAPEGITGPPGGPVFMAYAGANLDHKLWDVDSKDALSEGDTVAKVIAALGAGIAARLLVGDRDLVVLFHDRVGRTADNLDVYLLEIEAAVLAAGYVPQFALL